MTTTIHHQMAWTNERIKLSCADSVSLKTLWNMIAYDSNSKKNNNTLASENIAELISNNDAPNDMSLLKFLAINALDLSAPASPILLQQSSQAIPTGWLQLSGHPKSIASVANGLVRKRVSGKDDSEVLAYREISRDQYASKLVPKFYGIREYENETYLELQDLLHGFKDPNVMDVKMGCRTFLESEVNNHTLRADLYKKMVAVDPTAPTAEEHGQKAVTKLRYMLFREQMSSSHTKGFRIEALKMRNTAPITELKTVKDEQEVSATFSHFLNGRKAITKDLIKRLKVLRSMIEKSPFFMQHEIVGSSVFIVYDDDNVRVWLIDFAKAKKLPDGIKVTHRRKWVPGNCEEGLLHGMDELINVVEAIYTTQMKSDVRKCNRR